MLATLIRKEFAHQLISAKFTVMLLLVLVLSVASSLVMISDYQLRMENYTILAPDGQDIVALRKPVPMSMLVKGLDERMGRSITIGPLGMLEVGTSQSAANRLFALFRQLDMHFIALVIMSLAAILFSFDMISGEKRNGTLKMMLANGISRNKILLAKWIAALLVVAIPVFIALIVNLIMLQFMVPAAVGAELYARTILFALSILLYLTVFISIGLLISSLSHRPSVSLIFSMLVWALLVFVVPGSAALAAKNATGADPPNLLEYRVREIWTSDIFLFINNPDQEIDSTEYYHGIGSRLSAVYQQYLNEAERTTDILGQLSVVSPAGPFNFLAWGSAGTGPIDSLDFKRAVLRYQSEAQDDALKLLGVRRNPESGAEEEFKAVQFSYTDRSVTDFLGAEFALNAGMLILMTVVLYALAFFTFIRYDVR